MKKRSAKKQKNRKHNRSESNGTGPVSKPSFQLEALEPRILLSATWVDTDTGDPLHGATHEHDPLMGMGGHAFADDLSGHDIHHSPGGDHIHDGGTYKAGLHSKEAQDGKPDGGDQGGHDAKHDGKADGKGGDHANDGGDHKADNGDQGGHDAKHDGKGGDHANNGGDHKADNGDQGGHDAKHDGKGSDHANNGGDHKADHGDQGGDSATSVSGDAGTDSGGATSSPGTHTGDVGQGGDSTTHVGSDTASQSNTAADSTAPQTSDAGQVDASTTNVGSDTASQSNTATDSTAPQTSDAGQVDASTTHFGSDTASQSNTATDSTAPQTSDVGQVGDSTTHVGSDAGTDSVAAISSPAAHTGDVGQEGNTTMSVGNGTASHAGPLPGTESVSAHGESTDSLADPTADSLDQTPSLHDFHADSSVPDSPAMESVGMQSQSPTVDDASTSVGGVKVSGGGTEQTVEPDGSSAADPQASIGPDATGPMESESHSAAGGPSQTVSWDGSEDIGVLNPMDHLSGEVELAQAENYALESSVDSQESIGPGTEEMPYQIAAEIVLPTPMMGAETPAIELPSDTSGLGVPDVFHEIATGSGESAGFHATANHPTGAVADHPAGEVFQPAQPLQHTTASVATGHHHVPQEGSRVEQSETPAGPSHSGRSHPTHDLEPLETVQQGADMQESAGGYGFVRDVGSTGFFARLWGAVRGFGGMTRDHERRSSGSTRDGKHS